MPVPEFADGVRMGQVEKGRIAFMEKKTYVLLENYMLSCMDDSAHDSGHIYRVLYNALEIARTEKDVDYDVLIAACLLHDIGRKEQFENPALCHAKVGSEKAYGFLVEHGFEADWAGKVRDCIRTHRYRQSDLPQSLEGRILFDADKMDVTGALGIARTLIYKGIVSEPRYSLLPDGTVSTGEGDSSPSFFQEYKYKLENVYESFYTVRAVQIAKERQHTAVEFYECLYREVGRLHLDGREELDKYIHEDFS